jgi:heat shock protein HslJ
MIAYVKPHLILRPQEHQLGGSGGCNRMVGSYRVEDERLTLGPIASTMMAYPQGMATEQAFVEALSQVETFKYAFAAVGNWVGLLAVSRPSEPSAMRR